MPKFLFRKRPFYDDEEDFEEQVGNLKKKVIRFPVFVIAGFVLVAVVTAIIISINISNNSLRVLVKSTAQTIECDGFDYHIEAKIDDVTCMDYKGQFEFDLEDRSYTSVYHATYNDYEYDNVVYVNAEKSYRGNWYGGKWNVEDYTASALDFIDFYKDFRKFRFDGPSALRFTGLTGKYNARQFGNSMNDIIKELSKSRNLNHVMHQHIENSEAGMVVTYTPDMEKVYDILIENIAPAYTNANEYLSMKEDVERNRENIRNSELYVQYKTNADGYLTNFVFDYTTNGVNYEINIELSNFNNAKPVIPDSFFVAAGIEQ